MDELGRGGCRPEATVIMEALMCLSLSIDYTIMTGRCDGHLRVLSMYESILCLHFYTHLLLLTIRILHIHATDFVSISHVYLH